MAQKNKCSDEVGELQDVGREGRGDGEFQDVGRGCRCAGELQDLGQNSAI